ncbi:hypothetical protein A2U01_0105239, partial [Trifolium medium]|nr:hypothetical protein [Trifolium medium]
VHLPPRKDRLPGGWEQTVAVVPQPFEPEKAEDRRIKKTMNYDI